ncbi:hypothetical protein ACTU45_23075 [Streptomyces sp. 24-1644]|uniref:hypothetical protein n=1 Tax=Streptomyces sp. 24-1644 TaxID=3457315 RepID=UPI003FA73E87
MAERRMSFVLDGRDGLSRVFDRAGDNATRLHRRISAATTNSSTAINRLTTDASSRLRDLRGRFLSTGDGARQLQGSVTALQGPMRGAAAATGEASAAGGALGPILGGVAAVVGASLLPALGALVPMMAGAGLVAGTLGLGFSGVGDAMALAGKDQEKYNEALAKMSPESRALTRELVGMKKEFGGLGKDIQRVMLPGFTQAVKSAGPVVRILGRGMTAVGQGFGEAAAGAGRFFRSGGFQRDLKTNLDLGVEFVREMTGGFGSLGRGLLTFGAKSEPTLRSFSSGLSGLLGKGGGGLVGMFKGLEVGIEGSSKFLDGFFSMINRILPAVGRFSGEVARALGPLFGEMFKSAGVQTEAALDGLGQAVKALTPVFKDLGFGIKAVRDVMGIFAPVIRDVGSAVVGSLLPSFARVDEARGPLQRLSDTIAENKGTITEVARIMGNAFLDMAGAAIQHLPVVLSIFKTVAGGMVVGLGGILHASAETFGFLPGIGDKLRKADRAFTGFKDTFISGLNAAETKARAFADESLPRLEKGQLKMNINNWNSQIETAKAKLKTVPPEGRSKLKGDIADLQAKIAQAQAALRAVDGTSATTYVRTIYSPAGHNGPGGIPKHAKGTPSAAPGLAWVGEEGPELVQFRGGERVFDHRTSTRMASGARASGSTAAAGQDAGRGLIAGLGSAVTGVDAAARHMAAAVTAGVRSELEIASPSKKMKALMKDVGKGLILGLTGEKSKISATAKDLVKDIWAAWAGVKTTKDSKLVAMVVKDTAKLQKLASARDKIAARIAAAKQYRADLTSNAKQAAGLSNLGLADEEVSAGSIQAGLQQKLAKVNQFARYIQTLAKRGLSKSLLRQVLDMGPDAGYAYASALAGMNTSALKAVNSTQSKLDKAAGTLGGLGADVMYDSGKNAGKGFLAGLDSQQDAIEKQMVKIAKAMDKAIRKALGIKSPSTVAASSGGFFTKGVAKGAVDELPVLDRAMGAVAGRMANLRPAIGRPAVAGGGGGATRVIEATFNIQSLDPVATAREVEKLLLKLGRNQGTSVTLKIGR